MNAHLYQAGKFSPDAHPEEVILIQKPSHVDSQTPYCRAYKKKESENFPTSFRTLSICRAHISLKCAWQYIPIWPYSLTASSAFLVRRVVRVLRFGFSSSGVSTFTPANSGSMRIRPQYSQTMIFLCILMSS